MTTILVREQGVLKEIIIDSKKRLDLAEKHAVEQEIKHAESMKMFTHMLEWMKRHNR